VKKRMLILIFAMNLVSAQETAKNLTSGAGKIKHTISGTFDVKLAPSTETPVVADPLFGNMSIDKTFHGDLTATSKGQMLSVRTATKGSAGYVALERVEGKLLGRSGSFYLQHSGTMDRGTPHLLVSVVPDSGSGELTGIAGSMEINIKEGAHLYSFTFTLPETEEKNN